MSVNTNILYKTNAKIEKKHYLLLKKKTNNNKIK